MDIFIKLIILYIINSTVFIIQDFRQKDISMQPHYTRHPTFGNILSSFVFMPIIPFMPYITNILHRRSTSEYIFICFFQLFITVAIYYFTITDFTFGYIFGFTFSLPILRKAVASK